MKKNKILWMLSVLLLMLLFTTPVSAEESVVFTPTSENCVTFSGWTGTSGLKRFDGVTTAPTGSGTAEFIVPENVEGWTKLYYWIPPYDSGYTDKVDCSAGIEITDADGNSRAFDVVVTASKGGFWAPVGSAYFTKEEIEYVEVTSKSVGRYKRLTDVKFVADGDATYKLLPENFTILGGWEYEYNTDIGAHNKRVLSSRNVAGGNATIEIKDMKPGNYYVYVHTVDFNYSTGNRKFGLEINDLPFYKGYDKDKNTPIWFGTHLVGTEYENSISNPSKATAVFDWEKMTYPNEMITVSQDGTLKLEVFASADFARFDAIVFTQDENFDVTANAKGEIDFAKQVSVRVPYEDEISFPAAYTGKLTETESDAILQNEHTKISFKKGVLESGNVAVQREIESNGVITVPFENGLGFMTLYADKATDYQRRKFYGLFNTEYSDGQEGVVSVKTENVFRSGIPEWLIPNTLEQVDEKTVRMTADGTYASIVATWTLEENDLEPKVTVTATAKKDGELSFGFFNEVQEISKDKVGYVLNPYRWQEKRLPDPGVTLTETNSTTDHAQMTYKMNQKGQEITLGVAVDQSSIDLTVPVAGSEYEAGRWPHDTPEEFFTVEWNEDKNADGTYKETHLDYIDENADFVINITGNNGGVLPAVFAPKMASLDSSFKAGDTYTFSYRPLSVVSEAGENRGWYDAYKHVAKDIRGVYDYRDNYYASMTDAAFNILNFLKDDEASGWDDNMKGHYNIEDSYWATNSNGLVYLQNYLLTGDTDLLMRRTLPSMGTMLTRDNAHLQSRFTIESLSEGPINKELEYTSIPMGNATFEGAYLLSRGQMPVFRNIAKNRYMNTFVESDRKNLKNTTDYYWYEHANALTEYPLTIQNADIYLNERAFSASTTIPELSNFINTSYTPHFQTQIDAYEITGDTKYLEGAVEAARRFLPSLRITDMPESKTKMQIADVEQLVAEDKRDRTNAWSVLDRRYRRGALMEPTGETVFENGAPYNEYKIVGYDENYMNARDLTEPFPVWVTARTGLGVEQFSTCLEGRNIMMSTWAGDILRLGYLSNDELMMDLARSSIVGRFANYPGYYYSNYTTLPGLENYPTEAYDSTSLYFHHAPVFLAAVQDYLFSNAYVKSNGNVSFPNTRIQGYAWFNNRIYGHQPGVIYDEKEMWPWLEEGTITVSSKQIDWVAGRTEGRAAFVLTNAGDNDETVTVTFDEKLGVQTEAILYDKNGKTKETEIADNKLIVNIPAKGIATVAVSGTGIHIPEYAKIKFDETVQNDLVNTALGLMYVGNTYTQSYTINENGSYKFQYSTETGYDVKAYALSLDPESYMGYVFVGGRSAEQYDYIDEKGSPAVGGGDGEKGIVKATLKWRLEGEDEIHTETDTEFPFEFFIPVTDRNKSILFDVETEYLNETKTLGKEYTLSPQQITLEDEKKYTFEPISLSILSAMGRVTEPLTEGNSKYCIENRNLVQIPIDVTENDALAGCYLSGYIKVKDLASTSDITETGYILFDNIPIVDSAINSDKNNRFDFSVSDIVLAKSNVETQEWVDGVYVGEKQGMVNTTNGAHKTYEWENLYITKAGSKKGLQLLRNGNTYTLTNDGAVSCLIAIATYENGRMVDSKIEKVIVSVNNDKTYTLSQNQKMFVWECGVNKGSTLKPLLEAIECE